MTTQLVRILEDRGPWFLVPLFYIGLISSAELLIAVAAPRAGMILHCLLLPGLLWHAACAARKQDRALLACLAFAPLTRIITLWLSFPELPQTRQHLLASLPLFAAVWVAWRMLGYSRHTFGLVLRGLPIQMAVGLTGLILGALEYLILRPPPLTSSLAFREVWQPVLILLVCTGLSEELIFRGLILRASTDCLGAWGLWYTALLFATMQIGQRSPAHFALAFVMGAVWAWIVRRTGSLLGVALAHGLTNIVVLLVMPFVLGP